MVVAAVVRLIAVGLAHLVASVTGTGRAVTFVWGTLARACAEVLTYTTAGGSVTNRQATIGITIEVAGALHAAAQGRAKKPRDRALVG